MANYPYPCRSKGTKITPLQTTKVDTSIIGRLWGVEHFSSDQYYDITSVNSNLNIDERDAILSHYKDPANLLIAFNWSWNTNDLGGIRTYYAMYKAPPKFKWTTNNRWTVTARLHGHLNFKVPHTPT